MSKIQAQKNYRRSYDIKHFDKILDQTDYAQMQREVLHLGISYKNDPDVYLVLKNYGINNLKYLQLDKFVESQFKECI
jgi:hypothetical protein